MGNGIEHNMEGTISYSFWLCKNGHVFSQEQQALENHLSGHLVYNARVSGEKFN